MNTLAHGIRMVDGILNLKKTKMTKSQIESELKGIKETLDGVKETLDGLIDELTEVSLEICDQLEPENCSDREAADIRDNCPIDGARSHIIDTVEHIEDAVSLIEEDLESGDWKVLKLGKGMKTVGRDIKEESQDD